MKAAAHGLTVAALYDVHGNVHALEAVLAEIEDAAVDAVVIGGDVVGGPWPAETMSRLRALPGDVRWLRGNGDRELLRDEQDGHSDPAIEFVRRGLTAADVAFLGSLPPTVILDVDGLGPVLFCHATPRNDVEIRTAISPDERWLEVLDGTEQAVVVCGHTHTQFDRRVGGTRVINVGSVGMAYEDVPGAYWAVLGPGLELRHTAYDVERTLAAIAESGYPDEWPQASADEATSYFESRVGV